MYIHDQCGGEISENAAIHPDAFGGVWCPKCAAVISVTDVHCIPELVAEARQLRILRRVLQEWARAVPITDVQILELRKELEETRQARNALQQQVLQLRDERDGWMHTAERRGLLVEEVIDEKTRLITALEAAKSEVSRLMALINTPRTDDFTEAARQIEHLLDKTAKAYFDADADADADVEKLKHHVITTAVALLNWHQSITGASTALRPDVGLPVEKIERAPRATTGRSAGPPQSDQSPAAPAPPADTGRPSPIE